MQTQEEIFQKIVSIFEELFEVDANSITRESLLYDDLDIDSIDAVDLVVHLKKMTGKKVKPDEFKTVRTVQDVVEQVEILVREG